MAGADNREDRYKWVALANTTAGMFMATLDGSIVIIALPAIFRGIHLDPLAPGNISYLLWMIMGYRLVQAVLVVTLGRLGDIYGRVKIYNAGFVVFTVASVLLSFDPYIGGRGALWLIGWRVLQAVGGSMLMANSAAILTDAFPAEQRGFALGTNQIAGLAGQFIGLVAGGLLAAWDWRAVFWINVPVGIYGTLWAYWKLHDGSSERHRARIDWWGNVTFALGLGAVLIGITDGIQPYGHDSMGWANPVVVGLLVGGVALLAAFAVIETRIADPMFHIALFRIRAFTAGSIAGLLTAIARGGLQFMLIIWLQGIWLPLHGYAYSETPLWAGIYLLPLTSGFLIAGPTSGILSDRFGSRGIASAGMAVFGGSFIGHDAAARRLPLLGIRPAHRRKRDWQRDVRSAQFLVDHGQRSGAAPRRRIRHAVHLSEFRHRAIDRRVLLAHDRRAGEQPADDADQRPAAAGRAARSRSSDRHPAAGLLAVRVRPGGEPDRAPAGVHGCAVLAAGGKPAGPHRQGVLPQPDLRTVPPWPGGRVRRGGRAGRAGGPRVAHARRPLRRSRRPRGTPENGSRATPHLATSEPFRPNEMS